MIIAIDGPSGSGKSTLARTLAQRLNLQVLDTGAMYRAITWLALDAQADLLDETAVAALAHSAELSMTDGVIVNGVDVTAEIRAPRVTGLVSQVAAIPGVRAELVQRQRAWAVEHEGGIVEGRDIGTVVFPDATVKVYLDATTDVRAERREVQDDGVESAGSVQATAEALVRRDQLDSTRSTSPLRAADDAIRLDSASNSPMELVEQVLEVLRARGINV